MNCVGMVSMSIMVKETKYKVELAQLTYKAVLA